MSIYTENGYENRKDYLQSLSEDYTIDYTIVCSIASLLGAAEDFDGLLSSLEDYQFMNGY